MWTRLEYDQAFQLVREIVADWDPYHLVKSGAPPDEFDEEIACLLPRLQNVKSAAEAADAFLRVFGDAFDPPGESSFEAGSCNEVGEQLYARLLAAGLLPASPKSPVEQAAK